LELSFEQRSLLQYLTGIVISVAWYTLSQDACRHYCWRGLSRSGHSIGFFPCSRLCNDLNCCRLRSRCIQIPWHAGSVESWGVSGSSCQPYCGKYSIYGVFLVLRRQFIDHISPSRIMQICCTSLGSASGTHPRSFGASSIPLGPTCSYPHPNA